MRQTNTKKQQQLEWRRNKINELSVKGFSQSEIALIAKSLELCRFYVTKNSQLFQQPQDILQKINQCFQILSKKNNSLKGASSNNICNKTKQQSLKNILEQFNLI